METLVTAFGTTKNVSDWVKEPICSVSGKRILRRISQGWNNEDAIALGVNGKSKMRMAFGEMKTFNEWMIDSRCVVSRRVLRARLDKGEACVEALTRPEPI